ncbi:hypothetical protein EMCRGX_G009204 [Ephydatia muelleri]
MTDRHFQHKKSHILTHTGERPHQCEQCGKAFSRQQHLKLHRLTHTGERPHQCEQCGKAFSLQETLKRHVLTHTGERPHQCEQCGKAFSLQRNLKCHMLTHTGERSHQCEQCGKAFSRQQHLKLHMLTHTGERPHQCEQCGKAFSQQNTLKCHMLTHTGEKPHQCEQCGKAFSQQNTLKCHMLTHTGEKPHQCEQCGKAFSQQNTLKCHMLTHTGEKPHQCEQCGKAFSLQRNLKRHMLTHTEEKPHQCEQCGKAFSLQRNLKRHMLTHTGEKPHQCEQCGKGTGVAASVGGTAPLSGAGALIVDAISQSCHVDGLATCSVSVLGAEDEEQATHCYKASGKSNSSSVSAKPPMSPGRVKTLEDLGRHNLGTWARHLPKIFNDLAQDLAKILPKILGQEHYLAQDSWPRTSCWAGDPKHLESSWVLIENGGQVTPCDVLGVRPLDLYLELERMQSKRIASICGIFTATTFPNPHPASSSSSPSLNSHPNSQLVGTLVPSLVIGGIPLSSSDMDPLLLDLLADVDQVRVQARRMLYKSRRPHSHPPKRHRSFSNLEDLREDDEDKMAAQDRLLKYPSAFDLQSYHLSRVVADASVARSKLSEFMDAIKRFSLINWSGAEETELDGEQPTNPLSSTKRWLSDSNMLDEVGGKGNKGNSLYVPLAISSNARPTSFEAILDSTRT